MNHDGILGFLGFGNMGKAIAGGLLESGATSPKHLLAYDLDPTRQTDMEHLGVGMAGSAEDLARESAVLILAVKPQTMADALEMIKDVLQPETLVVSIAAGISISFIQEALGSDTRVARVMPNTPALVHACAAGVALSSNCTDNDADIVQAVFSAVGVVEMVEESDIDAVTALSGSGPAYFFRVVECLVEAAVAEGLAEGQATRLAAQTLFGAGKLLRESGETAATLRERVTSKGGTTEAALRTFDEQGLPDVLAAGVKAAAARSRELGQ